MSDPPKIFNPSGKVGIPLLFWYLSKSAVQPAMATRIFHTHWKFLQGNSILMGKTAMKCPDIYTLHNTSTPEPLS